MITDKDKELIRKAWCRNTAQNPSKWSEDKPETDQCAVTACLIHLYFELPMIRGGAILPDGETESHYWNKGVDLTITQFPKGTKIFQKNDGPQGRDAVAYVLENQDTLRRYKILERRFLDLRTE